MHKKILFLLLIMYFGRLGYAQTYTGVAFYVVPHEEDWQLFMGNSAWNDIRSFHERGYPFTPDSSNPKGGAGVFPNGLKVVIINITAGNFYAGYSGGDCSAECDDNYPPNERSVATYWESNEAAENKSVYLAATRPRQADATRDDGWGDYWGTPGIPMKSVKKINGHNIAVQVYKNVVTYYLRIDEKPLISGNGILTVDKSTEYSSYSDLVNTIKEIYGLETGDVAIDTFAQINTFDSDTGSNPADHPMHYYSGKIALEAAKTNSHCPRIDFTLNLYQGFNSAGQPGNLTADESNPQVERKAGLYSAYCLGMFRYNALLDSGSFTQRFNYGTDFSDKEYSRMVSVEGRTLCPKINTIGPDTEHKRIFKNAFAANSVELFPNPANNAVSVKFTDSYPPFVDIKIIDVNGRIIFQQPNIFMDQTNTFDINVAGFRDGAYELFIDDGINAVFNKMFIVHHADH